jgi:hypothetical protein
MANKGRQQRLDTLRLREAQGELTEVDRAEIDALFAAMDAEEMKALRPAMERMQGRQAQLQQEQERLAVEAEHLERVVREHQQLLIEARSYLERLQAKRAALAREFQRITGREFTRSE